MDGFLLFPPSRRGNEGNTRSLSPYRTLARLNDVASIQLSDEEEIGKNR